MKSLSLKSVAALCAASSVLVIACTGAALAQDGPPPGGPDGPQAGFPGGRGGDRIQQLHDTLQITPAQEPSFQAWQNALKPSAPPPRPGQMMRGMTTPQRLDMALAEQTKRDADLKTRVIATKAFYNGLTQAQKQTMDNLPPGSLLAMEEGPGLGGRGGGLAARGGFGGRRGRGGPDGGPGGPQDFGGPPPAQ